jgi:hypothetical protein
MNCESQYKFHGPHQGVPYGKFETELRPLRQKRAHSILDDRLFVFVQPCRHQVVSSPSLHRLASKATIKNQQRCAT